MIQLNFINWRFCYERSLELQQNVYENDARTHSGPHL